MLPTRKKLFAFCLAVTIAVGALCWFSASPTHAQTLNTGLNFATDTGLSAQDPRATIAKIIQIALGFLGVIALGLILYAGFIWMTAKGEEEKINQAKKIMISAAIGLAIILASFAIVSFILSRLSDATGANGGSGGGIGGGGGGLGGGEDVFAVNGTTPADKTTNVIRNAVIRFEFTKGVQASSVSDTTFTVSSGGSAVSGQRTTNGNYIEFAPDANCEVPNDTLKCFSKNAVINVEVTSGASGVVSLDGKNLICGGTSLCSITFTTGEIVDKEAPHVNITSQQICADVNNTLEASSTDNYGVSKIDFFVDTTLVGSSINNSNPFVGSPYNAQASWNSSGLPAGKTVTLKATAYDLDSNYATADKNFVLSASHCCNGIQDADETGIDCGGSCVSCEALNQPKIDWVSPAGGFCSNDPNKFCRKASEATDCGANANCDLGTPNGATGNFVTIAGSGFGTSRGKVFFTGASGRIEAHLADDAGTGNPACISTVWKDTQVIAVVPTGATTGPITVETTNNSNDSTNDAYGPLINDFKDNTIDRPGLCALTPASGKLNDVVQYEGIKLNASEAYYGNLANNLKASVSSFNSSKQGTATVPNLASGSTTTFVLKTNVESNFIPFVKDNEPYDGPIISSIEPNSGPVGEYVTIKGSGFGSSRSTSKIFFGSSSGVEADYSFPDICANTVWTDKQIVVKVPAGIAAGQNYKLTLERSGFPAVDSGAETFAVTTGTPNPGICSIEPTLGQANSEVTFWGEYFNAKDANSLIRFYNNQNQQGAALTFWDIDQSVSGIKPWKAITKVPQAAASGPVRVLAGSPAQASNPLNFAVGQCTKDSDCGTGTATCCSAGLPEAGKCKATAGDCYGVIATSVYELRFSTGSDSSCAPDQEKCGTVCCATGSCVAGQNKCTQCLVGQNQCGDGSCCNQQCTGNPSTCSDPTSCSGYSYNQCLEGFYCPNSPGLCSPYPGTGQPVQTGDCGDASCNTQPGCANGACHYDNALNRCIRNSTNACRQNEMRDSQNIVIKTNNQPVAGQCDIYNTSPRWHINNWFSSCPDGWTRLPNNRCVDAGSINGACSICQSPLSCQTAVTGTQGFCATTQPICESGASCDGTHCQKPDTGTCDCCCRKDHASQDCCSGLTCAGSCGSGQSNLGLCSGCVVNGIPDDSLCNCTGTTGKYCDNSGGNTTGVCKDCSSITDPAACSSHAECCVDGKNNNHCTNVVVGGSRFEKSGLSYCAYYNCNNAYPNTCNGNNPLISGVYDKLTTCQQNCASAPIMCTPGVGGGQCDANSTCPNNLRCDLASCECKTNDPGPGLPCKDPLTQACTGTCSKGYQCLLPTPLGGGGISAPSGVGLGAGGGTPDDTCRCCCKPPKAGEIDTCKQINESLTCLGNQGACTSPTGERGLCCGCTSDGQCGDTATIGCGLIASHCCQSRPEVMEKLPVINDTNVCRNTSVEATFNQKMDISSFSSNALLVGDYGTQSCPNGYPIVASAQSSGNHFADALLVVKKLAARIFPSLLAQPSFASASNFCYVPGSAIGYDVGATQTKVSFHLTRALDANIKYYVILKGDPGLANLGGEPKPYYNANITNLAKIGMVGGASGRIPSSFNSTEFKNAEIWSFTTGRDVCAVNGAKVTPPFQLFQRSGQQGALEAMAVDKSNHLLQPIPNFYDWTWDWSSDNSDVANVQQSGETYQATATAGNKQDAQTLARAKATITADTVNNPTTVGQAYDGTAQLRLFLCENPWPVYYSNPPFPPGYTWPWSDQTTGIQFYYCRDKSGIGTIDDLPALTDAPVTNEGNRKICMFGQNVGHVCSSDSGCGNIAGSCLPEVLKEFFFFRENEPGIPSLQGTVDPLGTKVNLSWEATPNATKYKIYYGLNPGQYTSTVEVVPSGRPVTKTIDGLVNGLNYYFSVTALSNKNQESVYSNELKIKPVDTTPAAIPTLQASAGDGKIALFWDKVPEAVSYIAYLGATPRGTGEYAVSTIVRTDPLTHMPNVVFSSLNGGGLNNGTDYYVSVRSVDQYGNISNYAPEITKKPNEPYLISASGANNSVLVKWLPFIAATGYTVYYGSSPDSIDTPINVSSTTFEKTVSGLTNGTTYYFKIKAQKTAGSSEYSNLRSAVAGAPGGS